GLVVATRHENAANGTGLLRQMSERYFSWGFVFVRRIVDAPRSATMRAPRPRSSTGSIRDVVPGERIELPTNGLQNRCSTAELTRHLTWRMRGPAEARAPASDSRGR